MADIYNIIEKAAKSGKIDRGINEVTKSVERGNAKLVVVASDIEPKEITQHIPILCKEKKIKFVEADSKQKLGISAGIPVSCAAIAVINSGDVEKEIAALK
jgi:large subunit ribosomal protein L7Ae